ncbi:MAG: hypothetical protein IKU15_07980 [Clostridia bacterium]|nr:hypothetical protein [Clostridia bacterium]
MRKLNPLKEKVLEVSNDTFWYLTQKQEPICDPQECADELEDIYIMFPYGFEIGKYSANPDGTYDITFWPYEEVPDIFPVDYFWDMTTEKQLQVHLLPTGNLLEYRWIIDNTKEVIEGPYKVPIITLEGNKAFRTKAGSTIFLKGMEMP